MLRGVEVVSKLHAIAAIVSLADLDLGPVRAGSFS
jgi:hypothetical protein